MFLKGSGKIETTILEAMANFLKVEENEIPTVARLKRPNRSRLVLLSTFIKDIPQLEPADSQLIEQGDASHLALNVGASKDRISSQEFRQLTEPLNASRSAVSQGSTHSAPAERLERKRKGKDTCTQVS